MINLGDVTFSLGADTAALLRSVDTLNRFSQTVTAVQNNTTRAGQAIAASYRRQEKAAGDAFNRMQQMNNSMSRMEGTERFIRANEAAFNRLNSTLTRGKLSALEFQRAQETFRRSLLNTQTQFLNFRDTAGGIVPLLQNIASGAVLVSGPLGGVATRIVSLTAVMKRGGIAAAAFVAGLGTAVYTFARFGSTILEAGRQLNAFESQFTAVSGSIIGGWKGVAEAITIARDTGQLITDLAGGMARFKAASVGTGIAMKDVNDLFRTTAAAATKLQLNTEQTSGIFRALEQIMSKGTLQAEELRGQLGDRLPGAVQIMARALGVSTGKLQEMMKKGLIPASEALPKFAQELKRTFNIDGSPIDNYTASANNLRNAWFQLMAALDTSLGITERVMESFKTLTALLDRLRENLNTVKIAVVGVTGALGALAAPAILSGLVSIIGYLGRMALGAGAINAAINRLPFAIFIKAALAIAGATAALTKHRDEIILVQGSYATLGDYQREIWARIEDDVLNAITQMKAYFGSLQTPWQAVNDSLKAISNATWTDVVAWAKKELTALVDAFRSVIGELSIYWRAFTNNIQVDLQRVARISKSVDEFFAPWTRSPEEQLNGVERWYDAILEGEQKVNIGFDEVQRQVRALHNNIESSNAGEAFESWVKDIHAAANEAGRLRQIGSFRQSELQGFGKDLGSPNFKLAEDEAPTLTERTLSDKEIKAAQRMARTLEDMNREIERTYEEIAALQGSEMTLQNLSDAFKREDEVRKYARAMEKAGHATQLVKEKSQELLQALELRDKLENQRRALEEWQNTLTSAFDDVGQMLVDSMLDGGESMKKLPDIAKAVARDIFNTFLQLQLLNPLKNLLFGTNLPTSGGTGGVIGALLGGAGGFGGTAASSWLSANPGGYIGLWRNGGLSSSPIMKYARNGLLTKPTKMMTSQGPVIGGEAGAEALMPLRKDASGRFGVDASGFDGGGPRVNVTFAPVYQVQGYGEDIEGLKVQMARNQAEFEGKVIDSVRKAQKKRQI